MKARTWMLTAHALDRYSERVDPSVDRRDAKHRLLMAIEGAKMLPEPSILGDEQWELPGGGIVIGKCIGKYIVAVTVLSGGMRETVADVVEAARRIKEEIGESLPDIPAPEPEELPPSIRESTAASLSAMRAERNRAITEVVKLNHENRRLKNRLSQLEVHLQRITTHAVSRGRELDLHYLALKTAMRAIREAPPTAQLTAVLQAVGEVVPGFANEEFAFPERFTKSERRAAAEDRSSVAPGGKIGTCRKSCGSGCG